MSQRSHIAKSGRSEISACSEAWSAETSVGIVSIPARRPSGGENQTPSVSYAVAGSSRVSVPITLPSAIALRW